MNSALATSFFHLNTPSFSSSSSFSFSYPLLLRSQSRNCTSALKSVKASSSSSNPIIHNLKTFAKTAFLVGLTASFASKLSVFPANAQQTLQQEHPSSTTSTLSDFLDSNEEAVDSLKSLLQQKLENGEDEEALTVLERLVSAQPSVTEWKFLMARLWSDMGQTQNARNLFEEILAVNPLSFEALFENALLMDRCGEGEAVIARLEEALRIAEEEKKTKEARDVRLIMAQIHFLQKNVDEALKSYQDLSKEDPSDFRPYFCRGMIYSLLDKNEEAREQFAKYRELSPKKFEVEGYLRTSLSRMKLFGTNETN